MVIGNAGLNGIVNYNVIMNLIGIIMRPWNSRLCGLDVLEDSLLIGLIGRCDANS